MHTLCPPVINTTAPLTYLPNLPTCRYEPKDPAIKVGMREMLVQPGHLKGGYLLITPLTSSDK